MAANLAAFLIVVARVWSNSLGNLDFGDLEVILFVVGGMCSDQCSVNSNILAFGLLDVGEPLDCQSGPG
jgi:hypothetical protein